MVKSTLRKKLNNDKKPNGPRLNLEINRGKSNHPSKKMKRNLMTNKNRLGNFLHCWTCGLYKGDLELCKSCSSRHGSVGKFNSWLYIKNRMRKNIGKTKRGVKLVTKIKDKILAKLSERLLEDSESELAPTTNNAKLNCWTCGNYDGEAEKCYHCPLCNVWTIKKIFIHNRRYLRHLTNDQLHKMGFSS